MPLLIVLVILAFGGFILLDPKDTKKALAYIRGEPSEIDVQSIGDFGCVLRVDAAESWATMRAAALATGLALRPKGPNSAFRTPDQQASLIETRPGFAAPQNHSPHQEGIAVDIDGIDTGDDASNNAHVSWLSANAADYGWFALPGSGATKEPWHWEFHGVKESANV